MKQPPMNACNICGKAEFVAGPRGRLSVGGLPPRCSSCGSLERHRAIRAFVDRIRTNDLLSGYRLIRFSPDRIVEDEWFDVSEESNFEGDNSLDIQAIDRPDGAYDVVVCSHVLEHVKDDAIAIRELTRILSPRGFLILAVPRTEVGELTEEWGFADPAKNLHYRGYGRDFDNRLRRIVPGIHSIRIETVDPVTKDSKLFYILTKSDFWVRKLAEQD